MALRVDAVRSIGKQVRNVHVEECFHPHSLQFGSNVFSPRLMEEVLPKTVFQNVWNAMKGKEKFDIVHADTVALALKDWALKEGATHFTHWFQPLNGASAEKHDLFLNWSEKGTVIEHLKGSDLLRGEPDASSFPSGGLRTTHQARGYTTWDPASFPFLWKRKNGVTLCIPALFFSFSGHALDHKIPLLRSDEKINSAAFRLLRLCERQAGCVFSTLGAEQEYFLIDRSLFLQRPDLLLAGRTVFGARPAKGQELEDHYFGPVKDRVMAFMKEFEDEAIQLGIPIRTRHTEVAPSQYEVACLFEPAAIAVDHNLLLMELMRQVAIDHNLVCLLHEKPFSGLNGSGKHCNWSLGTDTGLNLLDPKENSLLFLTLLTAILRAIHTHAGLMRASIGSAGNDLRLGGSEAPPAILSVSLGEQLEAIIDDLLAEKFPEKSAIRSIDLRLAHLPPHIVDASDRNRTSFFAFTGNKFEFRAVGAAAHPAFPITVINAIVADTLHLILDEIADCVKEKSLTQEQLFVAALPCLRKHLHIAKPVLFSGNAYAADWEAEAERRGLPNIRKSFHAFSQIIDQKTLRVFEGILSEEELQCRYAALVERYAKIMQIEAHLMIELFRTQILPSAFDDLNQRAASLMNLSHLGIRQVPSLMNQMEYFASVIEEASIAIDAVERVQNQSIDFGWEAKAKTYCEILAPKMEDARQIVDKLEMIVDNARWTLPKYRELLYVL
ncbi:MAG TPA: glutamine synthetase III [Chlamydiales bacterium]|nr:glutamine synthetase III [Chlamydiales bacterium]